MTILFLVVVTLVWAAMFVLPLAAYAALGLSLLKSDQSGNKVRSTSRVTLHTQVSHA